MNYLKGSHQGFRASQGYSLVVDKDRLRIFAEVEWERQTPLPVGSVATYGTVGLPVYWSDRFGHSVTFHWVRSATGLPPGLDSIVKVQALNDHGRGVTLRYANWRDRALPHDLLRADFTHGQGPSVLIRGHSGVASRAPVGFVACPGFDSGTRPVHLGGMVGRPTTITLGEPATLDQPTWSDSGSTAAQRPPVNGPHTGCAPQVWTLGYDDQSAALASLTTPSQVQTLFTTYAQYFLHEGGRALPTALWASPGPRRRISVAAAIMPTR